MTSSSPTTTRAQQSHVCEICSAEIEWATNSPHPPRWCAEHRKQGTRAARYRRRALAPVEPAVVCDDCGTRLLWPSEHGLCGFCAVEVGLEAAA